MNNKKKVLFVHVIYTYRVKGKKCFIVPGRFGSRLEA